MLGDPVEVSALSRVFRRSTPDRQFCALGSIKANLGHLSCAAGVAGLIKAARVVETGDVPPNPHFMLPAPGIDFPASPFFVNRDALHLGDTGQPRRAGVSSFGVGGTNAHILIEEPPRRAPSGPAPRRQSLVVLSARSAAALDRLSMAQARQIMGADGRGLADIAYSTQTSRTRFDHRRYVLADGSNPAGAALALLSGNPERQRSIRATGQDRPVIFMFSGQGSQYPDMGRGLYEVEPVYRRAFDRCCRAVRGAVGLDLRPVVFPPEATRDDAADRLKQTEITQPALFAVEYAMARLWMSWGVQPAALIGHSIGEYVAAALAGVMSLGDAARLVAQRGALMASCDPGTMLAVPRPERDLRPILPDDIAVAAVNAPGMTVLAGPAPSIDALAEQLGAGGVAVTRLRTSHAFHSAMMDPILDPFLRAFDGVRLRAPRIDILSNLTGQVLTARAARDPAYWALHLRSAVRFADCIRHGLSWPEALFLEVGPGRSLTGLAGLQAGGDSHVAIASMDSRSGQVPEADLMMDALGQLWAHGARIDWQTHYKGQIRARTALPPYPFERDSYWVGGSEDPSIDAAAARKAMVHWAHAPDWRAADLDAVQDLPDDARVVIFGDRGALARDLLRALPGQAVLITRARRFGARKDGGFAVDPDRPAQLDRLFEALRDGGAISHVIYLWPQSEPEADADAHALRLQRVAQGLARVNGLMRLHMLCVTEQAQPARPDGTLSVNAAPVLALAKVIGQEMSALRVSSVDLAQGDPPAQVAGWLLAELQAADFAPSVAYIGGARHALGFAPVPLDPVDHAPLLRQGGTYVLTGGLGNIGLTVADRLARRYGANLVLIARSAPPPRGDWADLAASADELDATARLARRLLDLDRAGAVRVMQADVTDRAALSDALSRARAEFGDIHGVFHLAGNVRDGFGALKTLTGDDLARQLAPKITGARMLADALADHTPDFVMLGSSLSSVLGGVNLGYYAAANQMLDSFAASRPTPCRWISVNWDQWGFADQAHGDSALTPADGAEVLDRVLALSADQLVISTTPLARRLAEWVDFTATPEATNSATTGHGRPNLATPYEAPKSDLEQVLVDIWEDLLGLSPVGIHDRFFELGGHSLLAIEMTMRIDERFGFAPEVAQIFDAPTIAGLAPLIEARIGKDAGAAAPSQPAPEPTPDPETDPEPAPQDLDRTKQGFQDMYDGVTRQLDGSGFGAFAHFLNYGYVPTDAPQASEIALGAEVINRNSVKLALELVGRQPIDGCDVLDVGCGRGGTARTLVDFFDPASVTGLDLSGAAIAFCRKTHTDPRLRFVQGDAEDLPFDEAGFDILTNLESSHTYPAIQRFYGSVRRVLKPGGAFLYSDLLPVGKLRQCLEMLKDLGFHIEDERDITANVLLSCDEIAASRQGAFGADQDMSNFLAAPGSAVYEAMVTGDWSYRIWRLRRGSGSCGEPETR
ncbi:MAG: SDR family oxidoreductase, partial [Marinibacterium sp.]|nr:SDR family oxidoreductase [Marinibacterium sp.]